MPEYLSLVENPELYECKIRRYTLGHSTMYMMLYNMTNTEDRFYLIFSYVYYFSGAMFWKGGADFQIASDNEMLKIARKVDRLNRFTDVELLSRRPSIKLYKAVLPEDTILILSSGVSRSERDETHF